ncbi:MAG TPA: SusC/RagA family TonB-linked outer membrane protein, partial [Niastella sp.]|nr:SusC/RagA family TonB-linked outer membrane protein [Niastella sp.]
GSFVQIDNKLLSRGVSLDVLSRMEGVASGVNFYRTSKSDQPTLNIRGRSTIFANATPLIILDNFPYDGDIANINPNIVESITVLKDAAAASIYGVRAANGVIVITSKKGNLNQPPLTQFNTNVTIGEKPDVGYLPWASSADYIDVEKIFFANKWYTGQETSPLKPALSPGVEIMIAARDGLISQAEANQKLEALTQNKYTDQYSKYFLRNSVLTQNALTVSGGGNNSRYFVAVSFDKDKSAYVGNSFDRFSLNASNQYTPFKNFDITASLLYTNTKAVNNNAGINDLVSTGVQKMYPYAQVVDENGNAAAVTNLYRDTYKSSKESVPGFLDWQYRPLDELNMANNVTRQNYNRASIELRKTFSPGFNIEVKYQYEKQYRKAENLMQQETYTVRNLINQYYNPASATVPYPVPVGDILDQRITELDGHTGRAQLNFNQTWQQHKVSLIAGFEVKQLQTNSNQSRLYGYDDDILVSQTVDYVTRFATNPNNQAAAVPYLREATGLLDRYKSYYANGTYTFNDRYVVSASGRLDNTNFFGIKANQRVLPLWSTGFKWNVSREDFFHSNLFDQLSLRATYGYNGNINKDLTAYTTVRFASDAVTKAVAAQVVNPPNPDLRWEKVSMLNLGVNFALTKNILTGSIEYFIKNGTDIIGDISMDQTTGISSFRGNLADIKGKGVDVQLTAKVANNKLFGWNSTLLFSYAIDKVDNYLKTFDAAGLVVQSSGVDSKLMAPYNGRPVYSIYSFAWGGLDPTTGDPLGYVNGQKSNNYSEINNRTPLNEVKYNGPANPPVAGAFRNDFFYKNVSVSVNIVYKMGHYFRRPSIDYGAMFTYWAANNDLNKRWQKSGDEESTYVPSIPSGAAPIASSGRSTFYTYSEVLVEKADHIRLQDIVVSYDFNKEQWARLPVKKIHVYCNINNVGILWRANKFGIDPDALPNNFANLLPTPRSLTLGAKFDF